MLLEINAENPDARKIKQIVEILQNGGVVIYPTDTIYGIGCDITNRKAVERICKIKGIKPEKATFAFVCQDLSDLSDYSKNFDKRIYKVLNRNLPGAFTFILEASKSVPKLLQSKRKHIGIRVPDNKIALEIVRQLGRPILTTSVKNTEEDDVIEYLTAPYDIHEVYENLVDIVIDGGVSGNDPSTVVLCVGNSIEVLREGKAELVE